MRSALHMKSLRFAVSVLLALTYRESYTNAMDEYSLQNQMVECPIQLPVSTNAYSCSRADLATYNAVRAQRPLTHTPCASALIPATAEDEINYAVLQCPDQTDDAGMTHRGKIKCLMMASISNAQCPKPVMRKPYGECPKPMPEPFPEHHNCEQCKDVGRNCNLCEFVPQIVGRACVGLQKCEVGVAQDYWHTLGGQNYDYLGGNGPLQGSTLTLIGLCDGYPPRSEVEAKDIAAVTETWDEYEMDEWKEFTDEYKAELSQIN